MLHVQHFSGLDLLAHADQNGPTVADVPHPNQLRERLRHPVHSPDPYRQLQVQSSLSPPIHFRPEFGPNDSSGS